MSRDFEWHLNRVDMHRGDCEKFAERLSKTAERAVHEGADAIAKFVQRIVRWIAYEKNLNLAFEHLQEHGGAAPGPDGLTFDFFKTLPQRYDYLRVLGEDIRHGRYEPGPAKTVKIPKKSGKGRRTISIQNLDDRIVQRGMAQVMSSILDPRFDERSFGFRPRLDRGDALATVERLTVQEKRLVWVTEDIKDAFPNVPLRPLVEAVNRYLPAHDLRNLIEKTVQVHNKRGLLQGSPLSPLLLNVYLHHHLDRRWRKLFPSVPLVRYADDILLLCRTVKEAKSARAALEKMLLAAGMPLNGTAESSIRRLARQENAVWLGYACQWQGGHLAVALDPEVIVTLKQTLEEVSWEPNKGYLAGQVIWAWLNQAGPAYSPDYADAVCEEIIQALTGLGLGKTRSIMPGGKRRRLATSTWMLKRWTHAHEIWMKKRHWLSQGEASPPQPCKDSQESSKGSAPF